MSSYNQTTKYNDNIRYNSIGLRYDGLISMNRGDPKGGAFVRSGPLHVWRRILSSRVRH